MIKPNYFIPALWFILPILLMLSSCGKDSVPPTDNASAPPVSKSAATPSSPVPAISSKPLANRTPNLIIAFGQDKPPFVFGQEKRGIEIDIVREALKIKGYTFAIEHMPNNRLQIALLGAKSNVDGVAGVRKKEDGTYYSDDFITFENFAITKKETGIVIKNISDLKGLTIVAWQAAYKDLGKEFENLFSPMPPYNSPYFNKQYRELASQENQNKMFWAGRADVIVVDKTIFEFYRKTLSNQFDTSKEVVYYGIFPELTHFQVAFKDKQTRDDFNEGLKYIKEKGIYQKLIDNYIKP
jgi:polar amino acid transport system substrate-binding protein